MIKLEYIKYKVYACHFDDAESHGHCHMVTCDEDSARAHTRGTQHSCSMGRPSWDCHNLAEFLK